MLQATARICQRPARTPRDRLQPLMCILVLGADVLALEDRGLAMTMTALRVAYAAGGDGEVCWVN